VVRHLPNLVTLSRGLLGLPVALLVLGDHNLAAFWLFIFAVTTDLWDGMLARKLNAVSDAGLLLDPLSDKLLVALTWAALLVHGWAPVWLAGTILVRDAIVVALWGYFAYGRGFKVQPTLVGRLMISFEGVTLPFLLLHYEWAGVHWMSAGVILGVVTLALSLVSALQYGAIAWRSVREGIHGRG
jgi:CDP-diacylglycerol--glycerol-3-phosphate 3-phosphatidyltransferase